MSIKIYFRIGALRDRDTLSGTIKCPIKKFDDDKWSTGHYWVPT